MRVLIQVQITRGVVSVCPSAGNRHRRARSLIVRTGVREATIRSCLAVAVAAVLFLAGCGSTPSRGTVAVSAPHAAMAPAGGLRERAQALIWRLVDELSPPPGTRTVQLAMLPPPLNYPPAPLQAGWVRVQRTLQAPGAAPVGLGRAAGAHAAQADWHDHPRRGGGRHLAGPRTWHRCGRVQRHAGPALQHDNADRCRCRSSLAAYPDIRRASGSGRFRLRDDLRAALGADTRGNAHVYRPGRHQKADGHR